MKKILLFLIVTIGIGTGIYFGVHQSSKKSNNQVPVYSKLEHKVEEKYNEKKEEIKVEEKYNKNIHKEKILNLTNSSIEEQENKKDIKKEVKSEVKEKDKNIEINSIINSEDLGSGTGELAILIDDSGSNTELAHEFHSIGIPLSFAVIPYLSKSREVNSYLTSMGYTVILHLPMEGSDKAVNAKTKDLLKPNMSKEEIVNIFNSALANVGPVRGFNNHMGSVFTSSQTAMEILLNSAKNKGLFYIDSKTIASAKGYKIAKEIGIPTGQCVHFLDNSKAVEDIENEIIKSIKIAKKRGKAVVIGHYHKNMFEALKNSKDVLRKSGVKLVFVDEILE